MKRDYPRLNIEEFGRQLIESRDLDPIYVALHDLHWGFHQKAQWCMAYWCFYHAGVSSYLSELSPERFWSEMERAAHNEETSVVGGRWPRGSERRHFRGRTAIQGVAALRARYQKQPSSMVLQLRECGHTYGDVARQVKTHYGFGDWIAFKVADMMERVFEHQVDFSRAAVFMFDDPKKAAFRLWREKHGLPESARPRDEAHVIDQVVEYLLEQLGDLDPPPLASRPLGLQEVETVLCKWKSHMNGHYPLLNDITEIREGLAPWAGVSVAAKDFLEAMP